MKFCLLGVLALRVALADAVTDWNAIMRATVAAENPLAQSRMAAITHLAIFESVNAIVKDYQPYLRTVTAPEGASAEAAAVAAAHHVLKNYFPAAASNLDSERTRSLARIPDGPAKIAGIGVGEAAAMAMIAQRANDGASASAQYTPMPGVGYWTPTPPALASAVLVQWGRVKPFGIARGDQFRPKPPPALTSRRYSRDYNEVKMVGDVLSLEAARPQDRIDVARYAGATGPVQFWNPVAVQLSNAEQLTLPENARLFALMNMAIADAAIVAFEAKYFYNFWRPVTAIRSGDLDNNPRTERDPAFSSFIANPAYPAYPSGHGSLSNAARAALERFFGRGRHAVTLTNPALPAMTLRYTNLRHITDDIADARIYSGIHFRFDQDAAEELGERVAAYVFRNNLGCARRGGCDADEE
jgi:hypothetical protein